MMLPGVELARRRRVHYHGDAGAPSASSSAGGAGEHHHHYAHRAAAGVAGPALAARIRLEEKLRGAALPPATTSPSRWSRLMGEREGRAAATAGRRSRREQQQQQPERGVLAPGAVLWPPPPAPTTPVTTMVAAPAASASSPVGNRQRAELTRTLSMVDVCAVCLEEVRERRQRVTRLPCSHKYHSECVLPWLAIHPDCPCCRALVPSVDALA